MNRTRQGSEALNWDAAGSQASASAQWSVPYTLALVGLAVFWAVENFIIQGAAFDSQPTTIHPYFYNAGRLGLNFLAAAGVLLLFSRPWLVAVLVVDFLISVVVLPYAHYFHQALAMEVTMKTAGEGFRVSSFGLQFIPIHIWLALGTVFVLKVCWAVKLTPQPRSWCQRGAMVCLCGAAACIGALQFTSFKLPSLRYMSSTRAVYAYGYINTWVAQRFYGPNVQEIAQELRQLQTVSPDRLTGVEKPWPVSHNIAIVQMESIGWNVLDYRINGQEVAPYLNYLARSSRCFRMQVYHTLGSEDMDYATLSGGVPSTRMVSYEIPGVTYPKALPAFMQAHGFHTAAFHGNDGSFFNRRANFERMGFDELWFKEDFAGQPVKLNSWGLRDADLFKLSSEKMRKASAPQFHFIITLDSHAPFNLIDDDEKKIFPHSSHWEENYFNSVRVLDHGLQDYIESLPSGTLVVLYGDHTSGVVYGDFASARESNAEFVPCIIHVCGSSAPPPLLASTAIPHDLRIHDVINLLRHGIEDQSGHGPKSPAKQTDTTSTATGDGKLARNSK